MMGENLRGQLGSCADSAKLYPICKIIHAEKAFLDENCQLFDFVFIRYNSLFCE